MDLNKALPAELVLGREGRQAGLPFLLWSAAFLLLALLFPPLGSDLDPVGPAYKPWDRLCSFVAALVFFRPEHTLLLF